MKIPKTIKICGHRYKIKLLKDRIKEDGMENPASSFSRTNTIWIDLNQAESRIETCLLHEIIEMLNYELELKLEHRTMSELESGLYQVLKDNKLLK